MARLAVGCGRLLGTWAEPGRLRAVLAALALAAAPALGDGGPEADKPDPSPDPARLAAADAVGAPRNRHAAEADPKAAPAAEDAVAEAKRAIAACRERHGKLSDYTCTLYKRERIKGRLTSQHVMHMKARTQPASVYLKFAQPNAGREAIYVAGRNNGRAWVHDVGLGKLIAGTLSLDPRSEKAMEDCRHPITEAGLGHLIDTVDKAWADELKAGESVVVLHRAAKVGNRACLMIEAVHPQRQPGFLFHKVNLYIDRELGLPIRFEAYDWPSAPGGTPDLVEEYIYANLKLDIGLREIDFDPKNRAYSFGRF